MGGSESASAAVVPTLTVSSFPLFSSTVPTSATPPLSIPSASRPSVPSAPTTLTTISATTTQSIATQSPLSPVPPIQNHTEVFYPGPDQGSTFGNATIVNHCKKSLYLSSVGSHKLGGFRDVKNQSTSWGTAPEQIIHHIPAGEAYTEFFRTVCAIYLNSTIPQYCWPEDKLGGQGISMKISADEHNLTDIIQFEYALIQNPARGDTYRRLDYDVSLLDCGNPAVYTEAYKVYIPASSTSGAPAATSVAHPEGYRDVFQLTDVKATSEDHALKIKYCPGYEGGLNVTFSNAPNSTCPHLICDGKQVCKDIYTFDRTREGEATKACNEEYHGDMILHLCAGLAVT